MSRMERSAFLKSLTFGSVIVANFLYPGVTDAARKNASASGAAPGKGSMKLTQGPGGVQIKTLEGTDPTYAGGRVVSKSGDGLVLEAGSAVQAVRIATDAVVWKEVEVTLNAIDLDDWVDVKGTPLPDGTLLAWSGWVFVNIGRRDGVIEDIGNKGMTLRQSNGTRDVAFAEKVEVIHAEDGAPVGQHLAALELGMEVGAVGLLLPQGGFRATRIWAHNLSRESV